MEYREFLSLTDEEIIFILTDIFSATKVRCIERNNKHNMITAEMTTGEWDDGEKEITDEIILTLPDCEDSGIDVDFQVLPEDELKWEKFLIAKGCHPLLKDNPYLGEA